MKRIALKTLATLGLLAGASLNANAQGFDMSMVANELQFQDQFYDWAWQGSVALAQQIPNDQPLPFNAMTISNSLSGDMRAFEQSANQWHVNSARSSAAMDRYSLGAVRGNWVYQNPYGYGQTYELPYQGSYWQDQGGYIYDSYQPYRTELQPTYGYGQGYGYGTGYSW